MTTIQIHNLKIKTVKDAFSHPAFAYARYIPAGQYCPAGYRIYFKCDDSPTGVYGKGGCSVEEFNKYGKHDLSPTEKY